MLIIWNIYLSLFFLLFRKIRRKRFNIYVWASLTWTLPSQRPPPPATTARVELQRFVDWRGRTLSRLFLYPEVRPERGETILEIKKVSPTYIHHPGGFFLTKYIQNTRSGCCGWKRREEMELFSHRFLQPSLHFSVPLSYESLQMPIGAVANEPYQESHWEFSCQIQSILARNCKSLRLLFSRPFSQEIYV